MNVRGLVKDPMYVGLIVLGFVGGSIITAVCVTSKPSPDPEPEALEASVVETGVTMIVDRPNRKGQIDLLTLGDFPRDYKTLRIETVVVDGCEYLIAFGRVGNGVLACSMTHKGNCKACENKRRAGVVTPTGNRCPM